MGSVIALPTFAKPKPESDTRVYLEKAEAVARWIRSTTIKSPNVFLPKFSHSTADFFLCLYRVTKDRSYLNYAKLLIDEILKQATTDTRGIRWVYPQYEFMEKPGTVSAFTGYLYGTAGFGLLLLRFDHTQRKRVTRIRLVDNPFNSK